MKRKKETLESKKMSLKLCSNEESTKRHKLWEVKS